MAESVNLTTPITGPAQITALRPSLVLLNALTGVVLVQLHPWTGSGWITDGRFKEFQYDATTTPTGASLIQALNKANLSTISLEKRIMNQLVASGHLAGTVSGAPD